MEKNAQAAYRRTVLVVDDEAVNREMLGMILSQDYEVLYAEDGRDAWNQLESYREMISLVLLDLLMPEMDGYQVLQNLRDDLELCSIPVIVLTSEKDAEVKSLQLGAADFLAKPYDSPEVILARVRRSIELNESSKIIQAAENDPLTGLYTREFFFEYGRQFDRQRSELVMDAIVVNFNNFHLINELYGRSFGNEVLLTMASDVFQLAEEAGGIACRAFADEFFLYIAHHWNYEKLFERIRHNLSQMLKTEEIQLRMGIYQDIYKSVPLEQRFDRALQACNSLRGKYGTAFAVYDTAMHEREVYVSRLLGDFNAALAQNQFKVWYQPKYSITGKFPVLHSMEALVNWQHPEFGHVVPKDFIPLFEKNGLIQKLDRYVWREAAQQMKKWRDQLGFDAPVSVNVSRVDMYDPNIVEFLLGITKEFSVAPQNLLLEITESAYVDNAAQMVQVVNKLRKAGFRVEMDDFGAGYSSLNMLGTLPIDALKLDIEFIRNIATSPKELRMVEFVLDIAKFLAVPVIAEGVETKEQYELLKKAGCDIVQGFYFSRQIPPEDFGRLVKQGVRV